ncbi:hypothetical protein [Flaviaesturariibacter terrae]
MHFHVLVRTNRLTNGLFLALGLLIVANVLICLPYLHRTEEIKGVARILSLDGERNLPTAYNVFLLLADAVLLFVLAARAVPKGLLKALAWLTLSLGFVLMGMDEAWTLHEDLIGPIRQRLGNRQLGLLYYSWIIPGLAVAAVVGLAYLRFLMSLPKPTRIGFVLSAFIYLSGALGMEALDGSYFESHGNNFVYKMLTIVEEGLEMSGLILFCRYLLNYIEATCGSISFRFRVPAPPAEVRNPLVRRAHVPGIHRREHAPIAPSQIVRRITPDRERT